MVLYKNIKTYVFITHLLPYMICLHPRKTHKICAYAKSSTTARRRSHTGDENIQDGEGCGSHQSDDDDFFNVQLFLGDDVSRDGDHDTLDDVFNSTLDQFAKIKS